MLKGVRVLSFTHYLQGPAGVQYLADLGADVIKMEPLGGAFERHWSGAQSTVGGESTFFLLANRNQRSLSVNLKTPEGHEIATRLIACSDVLVENYRPGVMDQLGLGYEDCRAINPRLIYASCSGYGPDGPYRERPGQDLLVQALSGLAAVSGPANGPPIAAGSAIVDQHAASLVAMGVLGALVARYTSGQGCRIDVNLLNAALDLQMEPLSYFANGAQLRDRSAEGLASIYHEAPYGIYATKDGWIAISLSSLPVLADALDLPELTTFSKEDQFHRGEEISALVRRRLIQRSQAAWAERLSTYGVWFSAANTYQDVMQDPQIKHNEVFQTMEHPTAGPVVVLAHPIRYNYKTPPIRLYPPRLGEHSRNILQELGYDDLTIASLIRSGIIGSLER